jgi:hypothetical protein
MTVSGAAVFCVYAASFAGQLERPKAGLWLVALVTAIGATMAWLLGAPPYRPLRGNGEKLSLRRDLQARGVESGGGGADREDEGLALSFSAVWSRGPHWSVRSRAAAHFVYLVANLSRQPR